MCTYQLTGTDWSTNEQIIDWQFLESNKINWKMIVCDIRSQGPIKIILTALNNLQELFTVR